MSPNGTNGSASPERAFLLAVDTRRGPWPVEESLDELAELVRTAGGEVVGRASQRLDQPDGRTYLGKGRLAEAREAIIESDAEVVVADDELAASTQKAMEEALGRRVVDRSLLILDIFAQRARTHEGRVQVELARLEYLLPRLTRKWQHLERQGGGIGLRGGPGETQIEIDRRLIRRGIGALREEIGGIRRQRSGQRSARRRGGIATVSLVGYTNAGKSTLFNRLTDAGTSTENKLFATLDPLTRRITLPRGREVLLSDTVGFIAKLPTGLVAAFRATLEELESADLLLHVLDISSDRAEERATVVRGVLEEIGVGDRPVLNVLNKADRLVASESELEDTLPEARAADSVVISAFHGWNVDEVLDRIDRVLERGYEHIRVRIPYAEAGLVDLFHRKGAVETERHTEAGTVISGAVPSRYAESFRPYVVRGR